MNRILVFSCILGITLATACGDKKSPEKKIVTKENLLEGLEPLNGFGIPKGLMNPDVPVYTPEAELISREEMKKMTSSGEYKTVPYVDATNEVKLWLISPMTEADRKQFEEAANKRANIPNLKGKQATPFSVTDLQGKKFDLKELKGKIVVINFWFIGCKPCIAEMDDLNELVDKCKDKNVVFIGFANNKKEKLVDFLKKKPFKYNIIPASENVASSYGVNVFPTNLVVDQHSTITYHTTGLVSSISTELLAEIERLEKVK